jgi:hypothetical protein
MPASLGVRSLNYGAPVNGQAPLNRGLVAWWQVLPMTSGGSTWHDLTGRYDGTLTAMGVSSSTKGWNSTKRLGGYGELRFVTTGGVQVPVLPALDLVPAFTLSTWVRQTTLDVTAYVWHKYATTPLQIALDTFTDGNVYFEVNGATTGYAFLDYSTVVTANQWFHLVAVYNGAGATNADRAQLYVNGRLPAGIGYSGTIPAMTTDLTGIPFWLGRHHSGTGVLNGALDDVRLYSRPLTATDVRTLYQAGMTRSPQELTYQVWPPAWAAVVGAVQAKAPPPRRQPWRFFRRAA